MNKYEYKVLYSVEENLLSSYGKDGWEVVGVCPTTRNYFVILKRKIAKKRLKEYDK